jgi:hypothetical protein
MRIGLLSIACASAMQLSSSASERVPQEDCSLYVAALQAHGVTPAGMMLVDSLTMGIPMFAFNGVSRLKRGDTALADSAATRLGELNKVRKPVPQCLVTAAKYQLVKDSTLFARFARSGPGWDCPTCRAFALLSRPLISESGRSALIFVGTATGKLAGNGKIYRFEKNDAGEWIRAAEVMI